MISSRICNSSCSSACFDDVRRRVYYPVHVSFHTILEYNDFNLQGLNTSSCSICGLRRQCESSMRCSSAKD